LLVQRDETHRAVAVDPELVGAPSRRGELLRETTRLIIEKDVGRSGIVMTNGVDPVLRADVSTGPSEGVAGYADPSPGAVVKTTRRS
jgi:hypothetical protein